MFAPSTVAQSPTFGQRAARTVRLLRAFATLDDRPLDLSGRPLDYAPELRLVPVHERRPGTVSARELGCATAPLRH